MSLLFKNRRFVTVIERMHSGWHDSSPGIFKGSEDVNHGVSRFRFVNYNKDLTCAPIAFVNLTTVTP